MAIKSGKIGKNMRSRLLSMTAIVLVFAVALVGGVFYRGVVKGAEAKSVAEDQQTRDVTIEANRGTIYDSNGNVLAQSITVYNIVLSPNDIETNAQTINKKTEDEFTTDDLKDLISSGLAEILGVEEETVRAKCDKSNYYEMIKRQVDTDVKDELLAWMDEEGITCISALETSKRNYPYNNLASTVIGFTNSDNDGAYGIEAYYDDYLSGTDGRMVSSKNALGDDMPYSYEKYYDAVDGKGLVLTIDVNIQTMLENALDNVIAEHAPNNRCCGIVMNVKTGEILAMATKEDFDLNDPYTITDEDTLAYLATLSGDEYNNAQQEAWYSLWKNKAITELYEPGSVFKVVTGSAAIEEQVVSLTSTFTCTGKYTFNLSGVNAISCWKSSGHGTQDLIHAFVNSCNPAFITMGQRLGISTFYEYFVAYGLTERTGIDLPNEANSLTLDEDDYGIVELASASFGQTNKITPIQMITAFCASINDGYLVQPHVVKQFLDEDGNVESTVGTTVKRQVISAETSATLRTCLEAVVEENGSGAVEGYRILGKTGTAEKLDSDDTSATTRVSSMIAAAPADDPEIAVLIMVDEPTSGQVYGSQVAAPAISEVLESLLPYLGIAKEGDASTATTYTVPSVTGAEISSAKTALTSSGIDNVIVYGSGDTVVKQVPASGSKVSDDGTVILYTEEGMSEQTVTMVDLTNLTPSAANKTLTNMGLNVSFSGVSDGTTCTVIKQSVAAGETVTKGTIITLTCAKVGD